MSVPVQITFEEIEPSKAFEVFIREKAAKLDAFRHITACRCALSFTARRDHHRHAFHVRLEVDVPGFPPIVVSREHDRDHVHADAHVAIRDAFAMARRELHLLQ